MLGSVFRTRAGARTSLIQVVVGAVLLSGLAVVDLSGQVNDKDCWAPPSGKCNDPAGDCNWRQQFDVCWHCLGNNPVSAICIYRLTYNCVGHSFVDCGARRKGICMPDGTCSGTQGAGDCDLVPCTNPT